jgi:hypothetical protein
LLRAAASTVMRIDNPTTTPIHITTKILEFCRSLDPNQTPVYVPVLPALGVRVDHCFYDIQKKIRIDGGHVQYGWTIWEKPEILIEAEFHAVWVSPENRLIDVTPKTDREQQILFLPDANRVWQGEPVDNVRFPLVDNAYTRHIIRYSEARFRLRKKYWRDGESIIPFDEVQELERQYGMHNLKLGRNDSCYCGSGKKYKQCHGRYA